MNCFMTNVGINDVNTIRYPRTMDKQLHDAGEVMPLSLQVADSVTCFRLTDSTQNDAREAILQKRICAADTGEIVMHLIAADNQTAGRGRLGRQWVSREQDSFLVSFVTLLPSDVVTNTQYNGWLPIIAGLAARQAIVETMNETGAHATHNDPSCTLRLKWPNDLFLHDKKEGGILTELVSLEADSTNIGVIIGIGLNLRVPQETLPIACATSLHMHRQPLPNSIRLRDMIASKICVLLRSKLQAFIEDTPAYSRQLLQEVQPLCWTLGRNVRVHPVGDNTYEGFACALGEDASLTIKQNDGTTVLVHTGDVVAVAHEV